MIVGSLSFAPFIVVDCHQSDKRIVEKKEVLYTKSRFFGECVMGGDCTVKEVVVLLLTVRDSSVVVKYIYKTTYNGND